MSKDERMSTLTPEAPQLEAVLEEDLEDELLVEEISIDGMCGVY